MWREPTFEGNSITEEKMQYESDAWVFWEKNGIKSRCRWPSSFSLEKRPLYNIWVWKVLIGSSPPRAFY